MEKNFTKPVSIGLFAALLLAAVFVSQIVEHKKVEAAATNVVGLQMVDWSDCSYSGLGAARYASDVSVWMPWTGDSDNYDPDCVRLYLGNTIPKDLDIRIGIQGRDINTPCGFFWLFKCGDGGGTIVYGPWASESPNSWTNWAGDVDMFDADQWRLIVDTRARYGYTVTSFKLGIQVGDVGDIWSGGGGCTQQIGTVRYTASSSASFGWTSWASDNYDNGDYNCTRINLISTSTLNDPMATLTGTSTVYYGNSINIPWTVDYINTTTGCTLTGRNSGGTIIDPATTITSNGSGSRTSIAITVPTTYTLSCVGNKPGTTATATKTISPFSAPATLSFSMSPTSGLAAGDISTSTITATNSSSCTLVGKNLSGVVIDSGFTYTPPPPSAVVTGGTIGPIYITNTSQTSWTVPSDWSNTNTIYMIGGGGGGSGTSGGGGGGYSRKDNLSLTPGQVINIKVGAGVAGGTGGDTYLNGTSCGVSSVCAKGGTAGGAGGAAGSGVGTVRYSGGSGRTSGSNGGGGGGGAAGPGGDGKMGGYTSISEGAGGGGAGGGSSTAGGSPPSCCNGYNHLGGRGGNGYSGTGAGTSGNSGNGGAGSYGGGGGGGDDGVGYGGAGGTGYNINGSVGSGGGGGGGGRARCGGNGGAYGGGGGGLCATAGSQGIIVIYYTSSTIAANTDARTTAHTVNQTTDYTVDCTGLDGVHVVRTVRVTLNSCMLDGVSISNGGSSNFYSQSIAPNGHTCSEYGPSVRGCTNGALTGNTSYVYASCTDQSSVIIKANGISTATAVRKGNSVALSLDGGNADSCTITGTDGFSEIIARTDGFEAGENLAATSSVAINQKTIYTAICTLGASTERASVTVNVLPTIIEN